MKTGKRGAIELSTNAIVVLILAVVMLGLGLGFVRGLFGKATQNLESIVGQEPDPPTPTSSNPVTLSRENVIVQAKDPIVIKVGAFNPSSSDLNGSPIISCSGLTLTSGVQVRNSTIRAGGTSTYSVVLPTTSTTTKGTYLCRATMVKYDTITSEATETGTYLDFTVQIK